MDTKIKEFYSAYDAAWNQRDAEAFTGSFLENGSAHFFTLNEKKTELNSRAEALEFYIPSFRGLEARPTVLHKTEIVRTQEVSTDLLLVDGVALITEKDSEDKLVTLRNWAVHFLLVKTAEGWRVFSLRCCEQPHS